MDEEPNRAPQKQKRPWILVPMREQPLLAIALFFVPLAIALLLAALLGR
jgi:hypothetical protein